MAKTNLFRAYGGNRNDGSKHLEDKDKLNFVSVEVSEASQESQKTIEKAESPVILESIEKLEPKKEILEAKKGKGRPAHNPGVTTALLVNLEEEEF